MPGRRPRIAVIGTGTWGRNIVHAIDRSDAVELARVCNRRPPAEGSIPAGVPIDADWRDTIAADIDGVAVATPPACHAEIGLAALAAGHDLFMEKPLALDPEDASAVLTAAEAAGAAVLVDHIYLFHPAWPMLRAETAGKIAAVDAVFGQTGPFREDTTLLWDWGPHVMALCLDLFGQPPDHAALKIDARKSVDGATGETLTIRLAFGDVPAALTISNLLPARTRRFTVDCSDRRVIFEDGAGVPLITRDSSGTRAITAPLAAPLDIAVATFATAISKRRAGQGAALGNLRQAVETVHLLAALDPCPA